MNDPSKCVVLVPVAKTIEPECEKGLTELASRGHPVRFLRGGSQIDLVRSAMASQAIHDGFRELMWIDSDISFDPSDVDTLRSHGHPFVAGLYVKKDRNEFACQFAGPGQVKFGVDGGLIEVASVGMGFTYIHADVFAKVKDVCGLPECGGGYDPSLKVVPYFIPMVVDDGSGGHVYLSEDYSFTMRVKQCGIRILADTTVKLGHIHRHVKTWDDLVGRTEYAGLEVGVG